MKIPLRKSLRTQFTIWTFLVVSLIALTVLIFSSYRSYNLFINDYRETLSEHMKYVAGSLTSLIQTTNYIGMARQANSLLLTYGVVGVEITDANGHPIMIKGEQAGFSLRQPILDGEIKLGQIQVNFSDIPVKNKAKHLIVDNLFITLVYVPLSVLMMWFLVGWKLKDILKLCQELHQLGDIRTENINLSGTNRQDEIGHLARSLVTRSEAIRNGMEKQQLLVRAIDQSHDSIIITDSKGIIEYVNPAFSRVTGYSRDEAIGRNPNILKSGKHPLKFYEMMWQRLTSGKTWQGRICNKRKDGTEYQEEATISPVFDSKSVIHHYVSVKRDVTKELLLEEQLNKAQKMEAIGLMAGGIAHDLNNILTGLVTYPDLILHQLPEDSQVKPAMREIKESGTRASEIVADLLTIARGVAATREVVNLNVLVTDYLDSPEHMKVASTHQTISYTTSLAHEIHPIVCSPTHIRKCIMNLVINSAESIRGSGSIFISTRDQVISNPAAQDQYVEKGHYTVLSVVDNGKGIQEHDIDHIFEPFYTKKTMGRSGTGLGLTVVWNTIQDHGGYITVSSGNNGTRFELYFPITHEKLPSDKAPSKTDPILGNGEHILVVDDERQSRDVTVKILTNLNYEADAVSSGEEALEFLTKTPVDLVLLDMLMDPGMNGKETYEEILKIRPGQKALIVSGFSRSDDVTRTLALGAGDFIKKPFNIIDLSMTINQELEKSPKK